MKTLAVQSVAAARSGALWLLFATTLFVGVTACDDGGTTTSCEDMPIIERHGEGGAVDPTSDPDYARWRANAVREGCATPSGDPQDFSER